VRYTAGVFLRSPLRLVLLHPRQMLAGGAIRFGAAMYDGRAQFADFRINATVSAPSLSLARWIEKHRRELDRIDPPKLPGGDTMPDDIARLSVLQQDPKSAELFARRTARVPLTRGRLALDDVVQSPPDVRLDPNELGMLGSFSGTEQQGSYNLTITTNGTAPHSGLRFVRKDQVSVLVR
jgi:hypothetical protein